MIPISVPLVISLLFCIVICSITPAGASEPDLRELYAPETEDTSRTTISVNALYTDFNTFNSLIRDGKIRKSAARSALSLKLTAIREEYYRRGGSNYPSTDWVFPVTGYNFKTIDRGRSHGFVPSGYDYFTGNRHGGHPAYDIFIHDRNQDNRDDSSGKAVQVVSMTGGIVVALEKEWLPGSALRGGKYIWIYDPANNLLVYYAHNEEIFAELGTIVKPGDLLATVGRSGLNAAKRRSPTHLHFSALQIRHGQPVPLPIYRELRRASAAIPILNVVTSGVTVLNR